MNNEMCGCNGTCGTEGKTPSAKGIVRINYKEDFELVVELMAGDKPYRLGDEDFRIDFIAMASRYTVGRTGGVCERCMVDGNKIRCFLDGHGLPPGELRAEVKVNAPDPNYADGSRLNVAMAEGVVVLVKDNTRFDGAVIKANIPVVMVDAYQLAKARGYKGTMEEYYATFTEVGHLKENIKGTLDEMTEAEKLRANAETERVKAETERQRNQDSLNTAEDERVKNEQQRQTNEDARQRAEKDRATAESGRSSAEDERVKAEQQRNSTEDARKTAESQRGKDEQARVGSENERAKAEDSRAQAETQRQTDEEERKEAETERADAEGMRATAEHGRRTAEQGRATAEAERITAESARTAAERERTRDEHTRGQAEQERVRVESARAEAERGRLTAEATRTEKEAERVKASAHLEELLEFVKRGDYADDVKVVNAIMNAPKDPTHDVWLDSTDGQVKCTEAGGKLPITAYKFYHIGKRLVKRDNHGNNWKGNPHVRYLDLRDWDMTLCTDAGLLFYGWTSLISLDASNWDLSALKSGYNMFANCSSLRGLDTSKWELGNLTSAQQMFANCSSLRGLDTSKWELGNLTSAQQMFAYCSSLRGLDTSKWELGNLTSMYLMFYGCYSLERLDFRSANFGNVTDANRTFEACDNLTELWLPLTFSKLTSLDLTIRTWGRTPKGLESLRWTFGEGAMDRTAKGLGACMVKLAASTYDRLTDDERAAAAKKGWTITK